MRKIRQLRWMSVGMLLLIAGAAGSSVYSTVTGDSLTSNVELNTFGRIVSGVTLVVFGCLFYRFGRDMLRLERSVREDEER